MSVLNGVSPLEDAVALFVAQLLIILVLSRLIGIVVAKIGQPKVIAEMICGVVLGPSLLGLIPNFSVTLFPEESVRFLKVFSQFGLILFLFLVGLELDPTIVKKSFKKFTIISTIGLLGPTIVAVPIGYMLFQIPSFRGPNESMTAFILFIGVAFGVSSLPILARILSSRHMLTTPLGSAVLATTAIDDVEGWALLAITSTIAQASDPLNILWTVFLAVGVALILIFVVRPILKKVAAIATLRRLVTQTTFFMVVCLVFGFSWIIQLIGLSPVFGAFLVGCIFPREDKNFVHQFQQRLTDMVGVFFLPVYFTVNGLSTRLDEMNTLEPWGFFALLLIIAFLSKTLSSGLAAKFIAKLTWKESLCFGILLQTKGVVAFVVFGIALEYGVITEKLFTVYVLLVVASTMVTTPLVEFIYPQKQMQKQNMMESQSTLLLACAASTSSAKKLTTIANDLTDSPFSIVHFQEIESNGSLFGWIRQRTTVDPVLRAAKVRGKEIGSGQRIFTESYFPSGHVIANDICELAKIKGAKVLFISGLQTYPFGWRSTTQSVVRSSPCNVVVLREGGKLPKRLGKILCLVPLHVRYHSYIDLVLSFSHSVNVEILHFVDHSSHMYQYLSQKCSSYPSVKYSQIFDKMPDHQRVEETKKKMKNEHYPLLVIHCAELTDPSILKLDLPMLVFFPKHNEVELDQNSITLE